MLNKFQGRTKKLPIAVVGASAGGLEALRGLFADMPIDTGVAFLVVQHRVPGHESLLADLIARHTRLPVDEGAHGSELRPNRILLAPAGPLVGILGARLRVGEPAAPTRMKAELPIDNTLRALASDAGEAAIAIILSGGGSDGANGVRAVKEAGGLVIAQAPETAAMPSMPESAIATGTPDFILAPEKMAGSLTSFAHHSYVSGDIAETLSPSTRERVLDQIVAFLLSRTKLSFLDYKRRTLSRRVERRMGIRHIDTFQAYFDFLQSDAHEPKALAQDLLISVTRFFRDEATFEVLRDEVIGPLARERAEERPIRVWVPGCATGEEAYSIAMLLLEAGAGEPDGRPIRVFASDIDENALAVARAGRYPIALVNDLSPERLSRFFVDDGNEVEVGKRLRDCVVFARQDLLSDPPFSQLDLISCRNVLIYMEPHAQKRLMPLFHYALREGGWLLLGSAESASSRVDLFEAVAAKARLFRRIGASTGRVLPLAGTVPSLTPALGALRRPMRRSSAEAMRHSLLAEFAPPSVLVDAQAEVLYFHGRTREILDIPAGEPRSNLLSMTSGNLRVELREALRRAAADNVKVEVPAVRTTSDGVPSLLRLTVLPVRGGSDGDEQLFVVSFLPEGEPGAAPEISQAEQSVVARLERELRVTRDDLERTIQDLEAANEAMLAANEDVTSYNEEMQSTNEELETSKEELQSLNEELSTLNAQLHEKVEELEATSNDLTNLLNSTAIATVFLDAELRVKRFTPSAITLFALIAGDAGRPLADVRRKFDDPALFDDIARVTSALIPVEARVTSHDGSHFIRRVLPYRTQQNRIEGVVVTFSDVTSTVHAGELIAARARQESVIADLSQRAMAATRLAELMVDIVTAVARVLAVDSAALFCTDKEGRLHVEASAGAWASCFPPSLVLPSDPLSDLAQAAATRLPLRVQDFGGEASLRPSSALHEVPAASGVCIPLGGFQPYILAAHHSRPRRFGEGEQRFVQSVANLLALALERRRAEEATIAARDLAQDIVDTHRLPTLLLDRAFSVLMASGAYHRSFGTTPPAILGKTPFDIDPAFFGVPRLRHALAVVQRDGTPTLALPLKRARRSAATQHFLADVQPLRSRADMFIVTIENVTDRKRAADELSAAKRAAELASTAKTRFLAAASHDLRQPLQGAVLFHSLAASHNQDAAVAPLLANLGLTLEALQGMMETLLDMSRLDAGIVEPVVRAVDLNATLKRLAAEFEPQAELSGLELRSVPTSLAAHTDSKLLDRLLRNLITNAIRYTRRGRVVLGARRAGANVRIQVWDTGQGIAPEQLDAIFEEFHQVGNDARERQRGLGLGLAIVRRLSLLLDHKVTVRSTPGRGSVFEITLPSAPRESVASEPPVARVVLERPESEGDRRRVALVLEDDPIVLQALASALTLQRFDVIGSADVAALLTKLEDVQPGDVHCIIGDYRLPGGHTGIEAMQMLEAHLARPVPGILLTGDTSPERLKEAKASGFALLHKPISVDELFQAIDAIEPHPSPAPRADPKQNE